MVRILLALVLLSPLYAGAESDAPQAGDPPASAPRPALGLDSLLRPRAVLPAVSERFGGKDEETWREGFSRARAEVRELEEQISRTQQKFRTLSTGEWEYTPAGGGTPTDPEVLKLRAQMKRDRQSLDAAERRLREMEVEASLSSVPDDWRGDTP